MLRVPHDIGGRTVIFGDRIEDIWFIGARRRESVACDGSEGLSIGRIKCATCICQGLVMTAVDVLVVVHKHDNRAYGA